MGAHRKRLQPADRWFFPAAALYGALAGPWFVYGLAGGRPVPPGLASVAGHAHEMLFGYALAVVAGFLTTRASPSRIALMLAAWLGARLAFLLDPGGPAAVALDLAFGATLALTAAPPLLRAAKKLRNRVLGPLVVALCLAPAAIQLGWRTGPGAAGFGLLPTAVLLFALLLLLMGGRIIAPAVAGAIERAGGRLEARVQPRIEAALLGLMILAIFASLLPPARPLVGAASIAAGVLAGVRLVRWRPWRLGARADLLCMVAGYAWLALGLVLLGGAWLVDWLRPATATHAITLGALGTLTTAVMARISTLRAGRDPAGMRLLPPVALLMGTGAALRLFLDLHPVGLALAAACWSAALLLLMPILRRRRTRPAPGVA
jgi:uncharacterized protein involved in response to NO